MTFYESQRWHSGEKRGFRLNVRRVAAAAAFASAEHFQSENALIFIFVCGNNCQWKSFELLNAIFSGLTLIGIIWYIHCAFLSIHSFTDGHCCPAKG
ncbi:hypothetical protein [Desulfovibrio sp. ZJ369]|uniref:hypothetical protein n=1 Tax=Desulfovibrio sp. ZJ369 TaxID=2709793 RepID=UPI0013EAD0C7|nr:hypothetical protein [Desulfovibrio sp. ZJ369]